MQVIVVEADGRLAGDIADGLRPFGFDCAVALSLELADARLADGADVLVVDAGMAGALKWLAKKRRRQPVPPTLVLTGRGGLEGRVLGLDAGADDYLVAPFAIGELAARLKALLRQTAAGRRALAEARRRTPALGLRPALPPGGGD